MAFFGGWRTLRRMVLIAAALIVLPACAPTKSVSVATPTVLPVTPAPHSAPQGLYSPEQVRAAYGMQSLYEKGYTGKGESVVLIESFGAPNLQADLATYSGYFSLPPANISVTSPLGTNYEDGCGHGGDIEGWALETTEDATIVHALAPDAKIVVLTSPVDETEGVAGLPEFLQLEQYAVDHHLGTIVSQSYAASELSLSDAAGKAEVARWADFYKDATTNKHMTFFAGSGDNGATDFANAEDGCAHKPSTVRTTNFPADVPWVTAVGGTTMTITGSAVSETAWTTPSGGLSGGGFSNFFAEPDFQKALPVAVQSQLAGKRGVPDVAAAADGTHALAMLFKGHWMGVGGTSAGGPLWAGLMAIANQMAGHALGDINPALYKIGTSDKAMADFRDITEGNNSVPRLGVVGWPAVSGWDPVTGFGTPIADHLIPDLIAADG